MVDNFGEELQVGDTVIYHDHYSGISYGVIRKFTKVLVTIDRHTPTGGINNGWSRKRPEDIIKVRHR